MEQIALALIAVLVPLATVIAGLRRTTAVLPAAEVASADHATRSPVADHPPAA